MHTDFETMIKVLGELAYTGSRMTAPQLANRPTLQDTDMRQIRRAAERLVEQSRVDQGIGYGGNPTYSFVR